MITVKRLPGGYWHIRGRGPCNWAQVEQWPCTEKQFRKGMFPEASENFIKEAMKVSYDK